MFPPFEEPEFAAPWEMWIRGTFLHMFVLQNGRWIWPTLETLHFMGLSLLFATVGVFDLRVLGVGKGIPLSALHRLIPIGIAGFGVNVVTGISFFSAFPEQYFYNSAFWWKGTFMAVCHECRMSKRRVTVRERRRAVCCRSYGRILVTP